MKIYIYSNDSQKEYVSKTKKLISVLEKNLNAKILLSEKTSNELFNNNSYLGCVEDADFIISLGGDGTVLTAAHLAIDYQKPILGINSGRLGYLCGYNYDDIEKISLYDFEKLEKSTRSLLTFKFNDKQYIAINDCIIIKQHPGKTIELNVYCNNKKVSYVRGDGIVLATPTGSSAYNLSCGGSIIASNVDAFAVTPICAHLSYTNPMIVNGCDTIKIEILNPEFNDAILLCDGEKAGVVTSNIEITKSNKSFVLLTKTK